MKNQPWVIIGILILVGCTNHTDDISFKSENCFSSFIFSQIVENKYGEWTDQQLAPWPIKACLPKTFIKYSDKKNGDVFANGIISFGVMEKGSPYFPPPDTSVPYFDITMYKAETIANDTLQQWIERNYSYSTEVVMKPKISERCYEKGFKSPHFLTIDIYERLENSDGEFAKFRACKNINIFYATRIGREVYLLKQDGFFELGGLNEELLLNVIRSIRPID